MVNPAPMPALRDAHAVVIGGSMAGLLAARVLADHVAQVTILDRDRFPLTPAQRMGVPQAYHAHALLAAGQGILQQLFPGLMADLIADGAFVGRNVVPLAIVSPAGKLPLPDTADTFVAFSRVLLEWHVRQHLSRRATIRTLPQTEVTGILATANGQRVTGVRFHPRGDPAQHDTMAADLVIDASGRASHITAWLAQWGYPAPPEERITSGLGYASRVYQRPDAFPTEWQGLIINGRPPHNPRAGLILPIEHGQWHVSLGGFAQHYPPTDEAGFLQWARELADPSLAEAIRVAQPLTPIRGYRTPVNHWRHFERLRRWPAGLIVMGDAVCAFNPIYGQGMTVSALDAMTLNRCLQAQQGPLTPGFTQQVQHHIAETVANAWLVATSEDLRWPGVTLRGARPMPFISLLHHYLDLVLYAATTESHIAQAYMGVVTMMSAPRTLARPRFITQVFNAAAKRRFARPFVSELALSPQALQHLQAQPTATFASAALGESL